MITIGRTGSKPHQAWTDQCGALHDGLFTPIWHGHAELGKVHQHFSHLIAALAAAHIDDAVAVAVLGEGLRDDSLAAPKGSRNCTGACGAASCPQ